MRGMVERLIHSPFLRAVATIATGTAIAQALPILFTPVISRLFSPGEFGVLGLFTAFISMTAGAAGLSFPLAIVSNIPRQTSARLVGLSLLVTLPVTMVLVVVLAIAMRFGILGFHELPTISLLWAWIVLVSVGVFSAFRYWQLREQQYRRISTAVVAQSIGLTIAQLVTGALSLGGVGLISSEVVRRTTGVWTLARASWRDVLAAAGPTSKRDYWAVAREFKKFPLLSTPSSFINSLALALPAPLFVSAYDLSQAGQFSMSYRVLALPVSLIGAAVADVFHGQLSRTAGKDRAGILRLFLRVTAGLFALGIIPSLIIVFWGSELFSVVLGSQWKLAGDIAAGIMPWVLFSFVVGPLSRAVLVFRGQEFKLVYDLAALAGVVGGIWLGSAQGWSIAETARILGVTQSAAYIVYFGLLFRIVVINSRIPED